MAAHTSPTPEGDHLVISGRECRSRLIVGTGKFGSLEVMREALQASGTEMVTVALRRVDLEATGGPDILEFIDPDRYLILPNTSGAADAEEALRIARLSRAAGLPSWIKLEVTPEPRYLLPDPVETLKAAELMVADRFTVLPYIGADPALAKRLPQAGRAGAAAGGPPRRPTRRRVRRSASARHVRRRAGTPSVRRAARGSGTRVARPGRRRAAHESAGAHARGLRSAAVARRGGSPGGPGPGLPGPDHRAVRPDHADVRAAVPLERVPHHVRVLRIRPRASHRAQDAVAG